VLILRTLPLGGSGLTVNLVLPYLSECSWARAHRDDLQRLEIDIEFELVRLKYVDILETSPDVLDAVNFAHKELSFFHTMHAEGNAGIASIRSRARYFLTQT